MDFNQVRYFLALADTLNFTRAAEQCHVSQPALTQAIKRLEDELGGSLILREGRNSELTPLGKVLRSQFEEIERTRHLVQKTAKAAAEGELAELDIGVMCTIGPRVLAQILSDFQAAHPQVSFTMHDVNPDMIPELVLSGTLAGAFCARTGAPSPRIRHLDLFEEDMVVAFPSGHRFERMDQVPLSELANERYIDRLYCEFLGTISRVYTERDLELDVGFVSQREDWVQEAVRDGLGVSCIPRFSLLAGDLPHRRIVDPELTRTVEFVTPERAGAPAALGLLLQELEDHDWPAVLDRVT